VPAYSLLGEPLGRAGLAAIDLARAAGARVTVDLASAEPLLARGRDAALDLLRRAAPDLLFANESEVARLLGGADATPLLALAPAVVVKRGAAGSRVLVAGLPPVDVATRPLVAADTTGAGDAFDAGFIVAWAAAIRAGATAAAALRGGAVSGNGTARRHLAAPRPELVLG
jgi:sugar/nucleoside kinase (ribokinase family)